MITINGVVISGGKSITISGNKILVDGKDVTPDSKQITIDVKGNVEKLQVDCCENLSVTGTVGDIKTQSGDVNCGHVTGNIQTMSGDVDCGNVAGSISTMSGDIKHRKI